MNQYPINDSHSIPEGPKFPGSAIIGPDIYHQFSRISLEQHIQRAKGFLAEAYCSGNLHNEKPTDDVHDEVLSSTFMGEYQTIFNDLKKGSSATACEDHIFQSLTLVFQSSALQTCFSRAMTWALCADLLYQTGFKNNAWSTLIEYKKSELRVEIAYEEERKLFISSRNKASAHENYTIRKHLKDYFLEFLKTKAPPNGWKTMKLAVNELAPQLRLVHMNSPHASKYHPTVSEVKTWLKSWLQNDATCKNTYFLYKSSSEGKPISK